MNIPVRISLVSYLNSRPFLYGLRHSTLARSIELQLDNPAVCADKLTQGSVDIGLVPAAILPKLPDYQIVSEYCIGAFGPVESVLLVSDVPLESISSVLLDYQSRTSVSLVRILAEQLWHITPEWHPATPGFEAKIVDPETGQDLGDNVQGEFCGRGHGVMIGYYQMPEKTAEAIDAEGWLHTGDLATRMPNGYYRITGRLKDMVIRGGENVYPREIEERLHAHPAVEDVQVVGVPDRKYGEELLAWVKLRTGQAATQEELCQFCRATLTHFKVPRYWKFVDSFPTTVTGKIQKFKIRQIAIEELGLQDAAKIETA